jgi:hypothetical protein
MRRRRRAAKPASSWPTAQPRDVREEPVEPPGNAGLIGALRLHRIAYGREPALQPAAVRRVKPPEKTPRQKQARRHTQRRQFESPDELPARSHISTGNIDSQQHSWVRIHHVLQFRDGLSRRQGGKYAGVAAGPGGLCTDQHLKSRPGNLGPAAGPDEQDRRTRDRVSAASRDGAAGPAGERRCTSSAVMTAGRRGLPTGLPVRSIL